MVPRSVRHLGLLWAGTSTIATVLLGGAVAATVAAPWTGPVGGPVWSSWGWWVAAAVYAIALAAGLPSQDVSARRFLLTAVVAAVLYLAAGSLLTTLDAFGTEDSRVTGSGWFEAAQGAAVYAVFIYGNGLIAFVVPLLLGLVRPLRPATIGRPARWTAPRYSAADDNAAAEDFGIY